MKNASEIMYKIGRIINIIVIPLSAFLLVLGIILAAAGTVGAGSANTEEQQAAIAMAASGGSLIGYGSFLLVTSILSLVICTKKKAEIDNGSNEIAPRVLLIVFGAIAENVFYILAGIFSLVARSQEMNNTNNNVQE